MRANHLNLSFRPTSLTAMKPLNGRHGGCFHAQIRADFDHPANGRLAAQIKVRRLPMPERSPRPFSPIVRCFPSWLVQEVAQLLEFGRVDLALDFMQDRDRSIGCVGMPGFIPDLGLCWAPTLACLILPD
jgi:hypothetical protein